MCSAQTTRRRLARCLILSHWLANALLAHLITTYAFAVFALRGVAQCFFDETDREQKRTVQDEHEWTTIIGASWLGQERWSGLWVFFSLSFRLPDVIGPTSCAVMNDGAKRRRDFGECAPFIMILCKIHHLLS